MAEFADDQIQQELWIRLQELNGEALTDAPIDGKYYLRKDGAWIELPAPIADAPSDGKGYVRKNGSWVEVAIEDAPSDGKIYVRRNGAWEVLEIS